MFVNNFVGGQRHRHSSFSLLNIEQGENESLRTFISRFNKQALLVDEMDDKILLKAFYNGVTSDLFIHRLYDQKARKMAKLIHSIQSFMNVKDAIIAKKKKKAERMETSYVHHLSKDLVQRKPRQGRKGIEMAGRLGCPRDGILTTLP